ncbi:hypothetical protein KZX46_05370 [Polymorphobacter sp. PAMC 29334]|uniref:hypothetical protein n=1 Tax=Polymorphobacter sp. PAMC 29334 TaxID=2862331 RepID=UPI001C77C4D4|nr:hypothetical protein [Polymorphobacter sp. PAMC 29334]QYE35412.1 hypothetical protein KZX46_05370 [Polymorphobacter sp. PAMC 29334]
MAIDWGATLKLAATSGIAAAEGVLHTELAIVAPAAKAAFGALAQTAIEIEIERATFSPSDIKLLEDNQKLAVQNVLLGYQDIGIVVAEAAVAAAWDAIMAVVTTAAKTVI